MATNNAIDNTLPSPFTVGATSVTSTGTQLNYLNGLTAVPINKLNIQTFTSTGSYTYTPTSGVVYAIVKVQGAGGGSGYLTGAGSDLGACGGAGGGGHLELLCTSANIGASCTGSVGTGGAGGTSGSKNGGNGGNTTFIINSSTWTAGGGTGTNGVTATASSAVQAGGAGGTNTTGSSATVILNVAGQTGGYGASYVSASFNSIIGGNGGNSLLGYGGSMVNEIAAAYLSGNSPVGYGAGGGGGVTWNANSGNGVSGTNGIVIVYEFISA